MKLIFNLAALAALVHAQGNSGNGGGGNGGGGGGGGSVPTCADQDPCIEFTVTKMTSSNCINGDCPIEVCLNLNGNNGNCNKGSGTFSHVCSQSSGSNGCTAWKDADEEVPLLGGGDGTDCSQTGAGTSVAFDGKCDEQNSVIMCQEGVPGETLYWQVKDGQDETIEVADQYFAKTFDFGGSSTCTVQVECFNNEFNCGTTVNDAQKKKERTWAFRIPTSGECDICNGGDGGTCPYSHHPSPISPSGPTSPSSPTGPTPTSNASPSDLNPSGPTSPSSPTGPTSDASPNSSPSSPTGGPSGSRGDPHFKSWVGEHFEFHGQCDLVLAKDAEFADGLGLEAQVRTKLVRYWSYIKRAAIRIGEDILEVEGTVDLAETEPIYWFNFGFRGETNTIGGFPLEIITGKVNSRKNHFNIDLSSKYPGVMISISTMKEFVKVDFINSSAEAFGNAVGMLGEYSTGKTLARDRTTVIDDFNALGNEWQLQPVDTMLFHDVSDPQFPKRCVLPEDPQGQRRRRLAETSVSIEDAEKACASLTDELDRKECVYDIIATQDLDMVGAY